MGGRPQTCSPPTERGWRGSAAFLLWARHALDLCQLPSSFFPPISHSSANFLKLNFHFEIIVDSSAAVRNNTDPKYPLPETPCRTVLQGHTGRVTLTQPRRWRLLPQRDFPTLPFTAHETPPTRPRPIAPPRRRFWDTLFQAASTPLLGRLPPQPHPDQSSRGPVLPARHPRGRGEERPSCVRGWGPLRWSAHRRERAGALRAWPGDPGETVPPTPRAS